MTAPPSLVQSSLTSDPNMPVRVLFISVASRAGGAERSLELLIRFLAKRGVQCDLVGAGGINSVELCGDLRSLWRTFSFEPGRKPGVLRGLGLCLRWLVCSAVVATAIIRLRPHFVHANTTAAAIVSALPARLSKRSFLWHVRDLVRLGLMGKCLGRHATRIVAISGAVRDDLVRQGVPAEKVKVIPNGVDPDWGVSVPREILRPEMRARWRLGPRAFVFLNVGQYVPWKKQTLFVDAACALARSCPDARFVLVGGAPVGGDFGYKRELAKHVSRMGLEHRVLLLDWQDDMMGVYAACDALVHTASAEPFGRALIEAMSFELPVIAVRSGGPAEIIEHDQSGILVETDDVAGLICAMRRIYHDRNFAARLGRCGRVRVEQAFTADRVADAAAELYREIMDSKSECESRHVDLRRSNQQTFETGNH